MDHIVLSTCIVGGKVYRYSTDDSEILRINKI